MINKDYFHKELHKNDFTKMVFPKKMYFIIKILINNNVTNNVTRIFFHHFTKKFIKKINLLLSACTKTELFLLS